MNSRKPTYSMVAAANDTNRSVAEAVICMLMLAAVIAIGLAIAQPLLK